MNLVREVVLNYLFLNFNDYVNKAKRRKRCTVFTTAETEDICHWPKCIAVLNLDIYG